MDSKNRKEEGWQEKLVLYAQQHPYVSTLRNSWYSDLKQYIQHDTSLEHLNAKQKRVMRLKYAQY